MHAGLDVPWVEDGKGMGREMLGPMMFPILLSFLQFEGSHAINCYTCSSYNGSDINCEDPYNPAMSTYTEKCMVPKQGHIGTFPANFCIKIVGKNVDTWEMMVIRACVMKTMDTQCGVFRYQDYTMTGCILTCDYDGCNAATTSTANFIVHILLTALLITAKTFHS